MNNIYLPIGATKTLSPNQPNTNLVNLQEWVQNKITNGELVLPQQSNGNVTEASIETALGYKPYSPNFGMGSAHNPEFMVFASAIFRPDTNPVHGQPITWSILNSSDNHGSTFFTSATQSGVDLAVNYPAVKNVFYGSANPDESYAKYNVTIGASIGLSVATFRAYRPSVGTVHLQGNGTTTWTKSGFNSGNITLETFQTGSGRTGYNMLEPDIDYHAHSIVYNGPNRYTIERLYGGLGIYNAAFRLIDSAGNPVLTAPTSNDHVYISTGLSQRQLNLGSWAIGDNYFMGTSTFNFWFFGLFECFMVASPISATSIGVKWQPVSGAVTYKIYRSTSSNFSGESLIYSGAGFNYIDTGLTTDTTYYYKLVTNNGSTDTTVTTFTSSTL